MKNTTLSIKNISKFYKNRIKANQNISLDFSSGEITALVGHNGAGKTTLLNQVIGLMKPTRGEILINGLDVINNPSIARKFVSSMPQFQIPLKGVTVFQAIDSVLRVRGFNHQIANKKTRDIIRALDINAWENVPGEKLSGGIQRLTSFAMSVTSDCPIIVLDEPTNDVDPVRRVLMWEYLKKLANEGVIIIIVTHNLLEVERYSDRYILLDKGIVKRDIKIGESGFSAPKHLLSLNGVDEDALSIFLDFNNIKFIHEERRAVISLGEDKVVSFLEKTLELLKNRKIVSYEMKTASLFEDYAEVVREHE